MGESKHTSMFPELHRLYNFPGPSHFLSSTIVSQNSFSNPALFALKNSFQQSQNSPSSSVVASKKHVHPRQQNPVSYGIMQGTSKVMAALVAAPIERVCILMQCQNEMLKYGHLSTPYNGMKDCLLRTIKSEGVLSLWRGNSINVLTPLTMEALSFAYAHLTCDSSISMKNVQEPPHWLVPLGVISGLLFLYPLNYARVRLATDVKASQELQFSLNSFGKRISNAVGNRMFSGVFDVFKKTLKSEGIIGLYRGYSLACVGVFAYYEASRGIKSYYKTEKQIKENQTFTARIVPIIFMSLPVVFYPVMTLARRMMMTSGEATKYKNAIHAVREIVKHEGASSLYKGLAPFVIFCLSKDVTVLAFFYLTYSGINKLQKRASN